MTKVYTGHRSDKSLLELQTQFLASKLSETANVESQMQDVWCNTIPLSYLFFGVLIALYLGDPFDPE